MSDPILYCGDPHGRFNQIIEAAHRMQASAIILLGDQDAEQRLEVELAPIRDRVWWIPGNHDGDTDAAWLNLWGSALADRNLHGHVVRLPDGTRIAGLGGVFRQSVWMPRNGGRASFHSSEELARKTPRQDRWQGGPHRRHWSTIFPADFEHLALQEADVLVTHEAPGYHPHGYSILDQLAVSLGVKIAVHGHHHDAPDSAAHWQDQGFKSFGVGLRGVTAIQLEGQAQVIVPGCLP